MQSCIEYPQNRAVQPFSFPLFRFRFNLKQKLFDQFQQKWRSDMNNSSKVLCYKNFKDCFEFENYLNLLDDKDRQLLCKFRTCNHRLPIEIGRWQVIERHNRTCNICDKNEIGDEFHYVLQCPSLHDDRRRLLDSTYLTRVNVLNFANLFQSRNKIKLRPLCKFIKIIFSKTRPPG
jgi:hypothetical protein